ncbi:unnamed protein product [Linum trigynum]|uniref:Uncharacterized protein n=1 Tax=Linum trigynum TaxID=586398 RepID=A0AAV2FGF1_9ROSI
MDWRRRKGQESRGRLGGLNVTWPNDITTDPTERSTRLQWAGPRDRLAKGWMGRATMEVDAWRLSLIQIGPSFLTQICFVEGKHCRTKPDLLTLQLLGRESCATTDWVERPSVHAELQSVIERPESQLLGFHSPHSNSPTLERVTEFNGDATTSTKNR